MMSTVEIFLLSAAFLLLLCVYASKASGKLGIPTLVVFLAIGVIAGSEGPGGIHFDNAYYAQTLGIVALAFILFSGGLDTKWSEVQKVCKAGLALSTLGVLLTCLLVGSFTHYILSIPWLESLLIGAIISSTDAGAVFTVLRSRSVHLKGKLRPILEIESGSNDPMAVFLTVSLLSLMQSGAKLSWSYLLVFILQMSVGLIIGYSFGRIAIVLFNKIKLEFEGLYLVTSLALVLLVYSLTQALNGNGFLAVYVAGVVLGNSSFIYKKTIMLLHDGVSWLMQSSLFLTLGLLIYPSRVINVTGMGFLIAAFLMLVARPLSVFISLSFSKLTNKEKTFISWVGLRGSVPIVMATYPLVAGIENADRIFNLVFFVAVSSLIIQGSSIPLVSKLLKLNTLEIPQKENIEYTTSINPTHNKILDITIGSESAFIGKSLVELKLPEDLLVVLIERDGITLIPRGATTIQNKDKLFYMASSESIKILKDRVKGMMI